MDQIENNGAQLQERQHSPLRAGSVLDDRYEIIAYLGCGGMGSVYKARHLQIGREAAIKVLHSRFGLDAAALKRFQREAQIISSLRHPNILGVYSFGGADGLVYLAMEFAYGKSLGYLIDTHNAMPSTQAVPLLLQICAGMSHAHANNVLHRDLKPDNVMVIDRPENATQKETVAKVIDFGLAKLLDASPGQRLTRTGEVVGDPRYMSPEQCIGKPLDERTDIYSFGCLMYELLSGKIPFDADNAVAIMRKHIEQDPEPFADRAQVPAALEAITLIAMSKDGRDRYESFDAIAADLNRFLSQPDLKIAKPHCHRVRRAASSNALAARRWPRTFLAGAVAAGFFVLCLGSVLYANGIADWHTLEATVDYRHGSNEKKLRAAMTLAETRHRNGDSESAEELYREAAELAKVIDDSAERARCYVAFANWAQEQHQRALATKYYEQAISEFFALTQTKELEPDTLKLCLLTLRNYADLEPDKAVGVAHNLSNSMEKSGSRDAALRALLAVSKLGTSATQAETLFALANLCARENRWTDAQEYFERAVKAAGSSAKRGDYLRTAANAARTAGKEALAAHFLEQQLETLANDPACSLDTRKEIADLYYRSKNFAKAAPAYQSCVDIMKAQPRPNSILLSDAFWNLGCSEFYLNNFVAAEQAFKRDAKLVSTDSSISPVPLGNVYWMIGNSLSSQGLYREAEAAFHRAEKSNDDTRNLHMSEGFRIALAESKLTNRIADLSALMEKCLKHADLKKAEAAARAQIDLLDEAPKHIIMLANSTWRLALILRQEGREPEARALLLRAQSLIEMAPSTDHRVSELRTVIAASLQAVPKEKKKS